jgi:hypothetical protein
VAAPLIVEVLDSRGRVQTRARLETFPARIGRGYGNDVILDDPYADAEHLRVMPDENGGWVAEDAGSVNGTFAGKARTARIPVRAGLELRVGHTLIRFQDPAQAVRPAIVDTKSVPDWTTSGRAALVVAIVTGFAFALSNWLGSSERTTAAKQLNTAMGVLLFLAIWAGLWSLASRINRHEFNFAGHFALAGTVGVVAALVDGIGNWLKAIIPTAPIDGIVGIFAELPLLALLLIGHLALASTMNRRARIRSAVLIIAGALAIGGLKSYADRDDFNTDMKYSAVIRPVPPGLLHTVSPAKFFDEASELRTEVDSLAARANRKDDARDRR